MPWLSLLYRIVRVLPISSGGKLKLFLNLEWAFERFAHEASFKVFTASEHPLRVFSKTFIERLIQPSYSILDLGCKGGEISFMLATKAKNVVGIDYDAVAITSAKRNYQKDNLVFLHGEAFEFLKNNKQRFDVLVLSHVLEHLDQPKEFLNQFKSFFDFIYIELPDFDRTYLNQYRQMLGMRLIYSDDDHVAEFDRWELRGLLEQCGIKIMESEYIFGVQRLWCKVLKGTAPHLQQLE